MAKKSIVARQEKRTRIVKKYATQRAKLKETIRNLNLSYEEREKAMKALWAMPRKSNRIQLRNRCAVTGRPRGVYRTFGLCRHMIRLYAMRGDVPGLVKASW